MDAQDQVDQADGSQRTFNQWVAFLASSPEDDDPAWLRLEQRITDGPPREQWAIVRAFVRRPISDKARLRLGSRIVEPLLKSGDDDLGREIRASLDCDPSFSIVFSAVSAPQARAAIDRAIEDS